jgi:L-Ala-D/L-Glu epimerase
MPQLDISIERFPIRGQFTIARGSKTEAAVVVAHLTENGCSGRGECTPYARYGETPESVVAQLQDSRGDVARLPAGAARNALDCAFWDLQAKTMGQPVWRLAKLQEPTPLTTLYTLSLDTPAAMATQATEQARSPYKLKLGGPDALERLRAVRHAAPTAQLVVDANEGWSVADLPLLTRACADLGVVLIEQPLPAAEDDALIGFQSPVPLCADESAHTSADLPRLADRYQAVNIKLDKAGGLTQALAMRQAALDFGLEIMVGCMVASSLAMAPAILLGADARYIDLDGPLLLANDRTPGLVYQGSVVLPPPPELWG